MIHRLRSRPIPSMPFFGLTLLAMDPRGAAEVGAAQALRHGQGAGVVVGTFTGLVLLFPCPWYMVAVGGLLPLPVILAFGLSGSIVLAFSLAHAALYTWLFWKVARRVASIVRAGRVRPGVAAALLLSGFVALSFAPIYGSGENLLGINKFKNNAYEVYRDTWSDVFRGGRR